MNIYIFHKIEFVSQSFVNITTADQPINAIGIFLTNDQSMSS